MRLESEIIDAHQLDGAIGKYYREKSRFVEIFDVHLSENDANMFFVKFLLDRKHVIQYIISKDRGVWGASILLAIGPAYFRPAQFWSYDAMKMFSMETTVTALRKNLDAMDVFFGL